MYFRSSADTELSTACQASSTTTPMARTAPTMTRLFLPSMSVLEILPRGITVGRRPRQSHAQPAPGGLEPDFDGLSGKGMILLYTNHQMDRHAPFAT